MFYKSNLYFFNLFVSTKKLNFKNNINILEYLKLLESFKLNKINFSYCTAVLFYSMILDWFGGVVFLLPKNWKSFTYTKLLVIQNTYLYYVITV